VLMTLQRALTSLSLLGRATLFDALASCEVSTHESIHIDAAVATGSRHATNLMRTLEKLALKCAEERAFAPLIEALRALSILARFTQEGEGDEDKAFRQRLKTSFPTDDPEAACAIASYLFEVESYSRQLQFLEEVSSDCLTLMGDQLGNIEPSVSTILGFSCEKTRDALFRWALASGHTALSGVEWFISQLHGVNPDVKSLAGDDDDWDRLEKRALAPAVSNASIQRILQILFKSVKYLMGAMEPLLSAQVEAHMVPDLIDCAMHIYKFFTGAIKALIASGIKTPPKTFKPCILSLCNQCTSRLHAIVSAIEQDTSLKASGKQLRLVPSLMFAIEELEHHVIKFSKFADDKSLAKAIQLNQSRDFKIDKKNLRDQKRKSKDVKEKGGKQGARSKKVKQSTDTADSSNIEEDPLDIVDIS
jgi:hypothetical protein